MDPAAGDADEEWLEEADRLAAGLCEAALTDGGAIGWIGLADGHHGSTQLAEAGADLYHGAAGIGLFLAQAGRRLGSDRYCDYAFRCGSSALACVEGKRAMIGGGFSGRTSAAYALLHLAAFFGESAWGQAALDRLVEFAGHAGEDTLLDVVAGSAGLWIDRDGALLFCARGQCERSTAHHDVADVRDVARARVVLKGGLMT